MNLIYKYLFLNISMTMNENKLFQLHFSSEKRDMLASRQDAELQRRIVWTHPKEVKLLGQSPYG